MNKKLTSHKLVTIFLILFFTLQPWAKADDIRDFEIEGLSVGDTILKLMNSMKLILKKLITIKTTHIHQ